jgi:hypothetical protein
MSDRERSESGQFVETVTLEGVLGVFDRVDGPVITSSDVADALECTTEAARQKLTRLYDRGRVDKRKTGRTTVWWRADEDRADREGADDGVPDSDPRHIDPAGDLADAVEGWEFDVSLATDQDPEELREFVERAEAGEFGSDPGVEGTVRIARSLLEATEDEDV